MRNVVIYHRGCRDGFCAAWLASKFLPKDTTFIPAQHGEAPPDGMYGDDVDIYILDFSYKMKHLDDMARSCHKLVVLDHHQSAQEELKPVDGITPDNLVIQFDMEASGAMLAWRWFSVRFDKMDGSSLVHPSFPPWIVPYVQDRDLWKWELSLSRQVNAYISMIPLEFTEWDVLWRTPFNDVADRGLAVQMKIKAYVDQVMEQTVMLRMVLPSAWIAPGKPRIADANCVSTWPIVNVPHPDNSEVMSALMSLHKSDMAWTWFQQGDGRFCYSVRTTENLDAIAVARTFGGGGHPRASGFVADQPVHFDFDSMRDLSLTPYLRRQP